MTNEEHVFFSFTSFYKISDFFHFQSAFTNFCHFQCTFITLLEYFNVFFIKTFFKALDNYLMSNLTNGYGSYGTKKNTQVQILKNDKWSSPWK
jgi:hypothetical protein